MAPDADGFATGEAYFDDGVGYDFLGSFEGEGSFMRRRFTFDDGVLACGAPSGEDSDAEHGRTPGGNFPDAATRVERVVLLGADAGTYASEAEVRVFSKSTDGVSERTFAVDVERAPTSERGGEAVALAARKPDVAVADDWSVRFFLQ